MDDYDDESYGPEDFEPALWHKPAEGKCGGHVTVTNYPAQRHAYGWDPPEQVVKCEKCGEIDYDEVVEHLPDYD